MTKNAQDYGTMFAYFNDEKRAREDDDEPLPFDATPLDNRFIEGESERREIPIRTFVIAKYSGKRSTDAVN